MHSTTPSEDRYFITYLSTRVQASLLSSSPHRISLFAPQLHQFPSQQSMQSDIHKVALGYYMIMSCINRRKVVPCTSHNELRDTTYRTQKITHQVFQHKTQPSQHQSEKVVFPLSFSHPYPRRRHSHSAHQSQGTPPASC